MLSLWEGGAPFEQGERPKMTPYLQGKKQAPAVIVLPGGSYRRRADHEGEPVARWLNEIGIHAFVLDYRVAPYKHPVPLIDAKRAIRYVRYHAAEWNIDPYRIGILGFSAGGHLASTTGTKFDGGDPETDDPVERVSSRPDVMILGYPVITFGKHRHDGSMKNLLGVDAPADRRELLSNELHVTSQTPPTFLWHTAEDETVPVENSLLFASALSLHKVPFDLHVYESGRHGLGLALDHPEAYLWTEACEKWIRRRGF
jgi:acetyl esterase/lipase